MRHVAWIAIAVLGACGDNIKPALDPDGSMPMPDMMSNAVCGNLMLEEGEECEHEDGNTQLDPICDTSCQFTCGNGVFDESVGELCDTEIQSGTGICPTSCDDGDACTSDVLGGSECSAMCVNEAITAAVDGDGCCPAGANANTDDDCTAMCGNGILETGELCDTAITAGAGACPLACTDNQSCTTDALMAGGSCQAACVFTPITTNTPGDGCCRPGTLPTEDSDCVGCGNGVVDAGETCDTAITTGAGRCPTTCSDAMPCTRDVLTNMGTCTAACTFPAITMPMNNDGCCPMGANANNDNNCQPMCRNSVVEMGEQCDDGNMTDTDACGNDCMHNPTAFRFNTLNLRNPHAFALVLGFLCTDITSNLNTEFNNAVTMDDDDDGFLELSPVVLFRPLAQTEPTSPVEVHFAECTDPIATTTCSPGDDAPILSTATNANGSCLATVPNSLQNTYSPGITVPPAGSRCFASANTTVTIDLSGVLVTLYDARIGGTYSGNPATQIQSGLLYGFLRETDANNITLPADLPVVGGQTLSSILRGGTGNCASGTDKDTHMGMMGWWLYLNYTAPARPWTEP